METQSRTGQAPEYLSTLSTRELQEMLCATRTQPLSALINRGGVSIDYNARRVWRDSFWKGSFSFLAGRASVRQLRYPDGKRRFVRAGDAVLLLTHSNHPYRLVYDVMKVVDANNTIGVTHLGRFPDGMGFITFVLARNNYPFENMAVPDHDSIFSGDHVRAPSRAELTGSWNGYLVLAGRPHVNSRNQFNPRLLRVEFGSTDTGVQARVRFGLFVSKKRAQFDSGMVSLIGSSAYRDEIRAIDSDTLVGRRIRNSRPDAAGGLRFILKRNR